jgi:hypothetical protein
MNAGWQFVIRFYQSEEAESLPVLSLHLCYNNKHSGYVTRDVARDHLGPLLREEKRPAITPSRGILQGMAMSDEAHRCYTRSFLDRSGRSSAELLESIAG